MGMWYTPATCQQEAYLQFYFGSSNSFSKKKSSLILNGANECSHIPYLVIALLLAFKLSDVEKIFQDMHLIVSSKLCP